MRSGKACLIGLCILLAPSFAHAQAWPNQPSTTTTLFDCGFNHPTCNGALQDPYNSSNTLASPPSAGTLNVVTDLSAPISPPSVLRSSIFAGNNFGGTDLSYVTPGGQTFREMYVGHKWRTNPEFFGRQVANKLFFVRGPASNGFFGMMGGPGGGNAAGSPSFIAFGHNSGNVDNSHVCGGGGFTCFPNVGTGQVIPAGAWFTLEACLKSSTTNTSRDGIVKWWVNGQLSGHYTNLNLASLGLNTWVWSETWDGTVNPVPAQDWHHYIDHVRVAGGNGTCGPGGGTNPPPLPPGPTPPPPPPSGTPGTVNDLAVTPLSSTSAQVSFTAVDDGTGSPAKYDNRLAVAPINWGSTPSVSSGDCASPFAPAGQIGSIVTCTLSGLTPGQAYQMQNVAFRGTMNVDAIYGSLGNVASFTMPSSNAPTITNFSPASGQTGTSVTLSGSNFGATIGANTVKFNGQTATVTAASPTSVTATAPDGVTTGKISIQTDQGIVFSEQSFIVGSGGDNGCGCS